MTECNLLLLLSLEIGNRGNYSDINFMAGLFEEDILLLVVVILINATNIMKYVY